MIKMPKMKPKHSYASLILENHELRKRAMLKEQWSEHKDEATREFVNKGIAGINAKIRELNAKSQRKYGLGLPEN